MAAVACAARGRGAVPPGTAQPDQFLFDKGNDALNQKKWLTAREFFKQLTETYTQSPLRPDAKLGIGDTYLGEGSTEALVLAINEFQEFLSFYPTNRRADYAQYKMGMAHFRQMRAPQRDQSETRDTIREFETFVVRYPNSELMPEVKGKLREARDRLSEADYEVGVFYFQQHWYPGRDRPADGAPETGPGVHGPRRRLLLPGRVAGQGQSPAEALPYYEKLVEEFEVSEHLEDARKRIAELKAKADAKAATR